MSLAIKDGTGDGNSAAVDTNHRLHVQGVVTDSHEDAVRTCRAFNVNTDFITLTNATATPVLYLKNNEDQDFHVEGIAIGFGTHAGGTATDLVEVRMIRNPTGGTIISNASITPMVSNSNFGSTRTLDADVFNGATGDTITGGEDYGIIGNPDFSRLGFPIFISVPKGSSICFTVKAPASTTAMPVYVTIIGHVQDPADF